MDTHLHNIPDKSSIKNIVIVDKSVNLLKKLLNHINVTFKDKQELEEVTISRDVLLTQQIQDVFQTYQNELKEHGYKSGKLTSLHKNNVKQKFPAINMLRQILKCNGILMKPKIESIGYNRITGQKIVKRSFVFKLIENNVN
tara:strand:+ start:611 stop:1036 length:426 start_codon:yes stop_codon:yes gene_type:complete